MTFIRLLLVRLLLLVTRGEGKYNQSCVLFLVYYRVYYCNLPVLFCGIYRL